MVKLDSLHGSANAKLNVPDTSHTCKVASHYSSSQTTPVLNDEREWYQSGKISPVVSDAVSKDSTFTMVRSQQTVKQGWTHFNQESSKNEHEQTTTGYITIILAPAHEYDTLYTVIQRCKYVAEASGQKFIVLTADEALYC